MDRCVRLSYAALLVGAAISGCTNQDPPGEYRELPETVQDSEPPQKAPESRVTVQAARAITEPAVTDVPKEAVEPKEIVENAAAPLGGTPPESVPTTDQKTASSEIAAATSADQGVPLQVIPFSAFDTAEPRKIELLIPEKEFTPEGKEQALRVSFDDLDLLKVLNMEPVPVDAPNYFPNWLKKLDGQNVRLRGWMYPPPEQEGLPGFLFVRDNQICCFGRLPKVYDKVGVYLKEGVTTNYIQGRPFDVIGTLSIQPEVEDDKLSFLYFIKDAVVIDG